jgi:calcium-dependent protein kinase
MPFAGRDMREIANKIVNSNGKLSFPGERWPNISELGRDFVTTLLTYDASTRPTSEEALRHPWLSCLSLSKSGKMSTKFFGRRNSSESFGGSAHLASKQHTTTTTNKVLPVPQSAMETVMQASRVLSSFKLLSSESRVLTSIENYSTYSWMHRLALMVIAYRYSGEETAHLRRIFTSFDIDQSGVLNSEELRVAFTMHGKYTIDELESIFLALDMTGCGTISWTEFLAATIETIGPVSEDEFSSAFDHIDLDKSGYISTQNLKDILGDKISQNTLDRIIDEADIAGDHKIWRNEFMVLANESFAVDHYDNDDDDTVMENEPRPVSLAKSLGHQPFVLGTDFTFESMDSISDYDDDDDHGSQYFGAERMKSLRKAKKQIV